MTNKVVEVHATFEQLFCKAINEKQTQYLTRIPKLLLAPNQQTLINFVNECLESQFVPSLDTIRTKHHILETTTEIPLDVLYTNFCANAREAYLAVQMREYVEKNGTNGFVEYMDGLIDKTIVPNPEVIAYSQLPRESYETNIFRSSWYIPYFDEMTSGISGGDLVVFYAPTKSYKTTLLKLLAYTAFTHKETVMFCSQEQSVLSMAQQLDMLALGKAHNILRSGIDTQTMDELKKLQSNVSKFGSEIYITPQVKSVKQLHEYIVSLNVPIKKVYIDGLSLMGESGANSYESLSTVCANLKEYANKHNIIIIVVTQSNREGAKAGMSLSATNIAGSWAIATYCDFLVALSPLEENGEKFVYIRTLLNRHGDDSTKILMYVNYTKDGKMKIDLARVDDKYNPEQPLISQQTSAKLKMDFQKITGIDFDDAMGALGENKAKAVMTLAQLDTQLADEIEGAF